MNLSLMINMGIEPDINSFMLPPAEDEAAYITSKLDDLDRYRLDLMREYLALVDLYPNTHPAMFCTKRFATHETYEWLVEELKNANH